MKAINVFRYLVLCVLLLIAVVCFPELNGWLHTLPAWIIAIVILIPIAILAWLFFSLVRPFHTISTGMDLLLAQDFSSRLAPVGQIDADHLVRMFNNMMDQLKSERMKLHEQNHFLQKLIEASPIGIAVLDFDGRIADVNPAMRHLLADMTSEELAGKTMADIRHRSELARCLANLPQESTHTFRLSDTDIIRCSHLSFMESGFARPYIFAEPLTNEVIEAEKTAYGKVIRIIAHEVNNTLAGVNSILQTIRDIMQPDPTTSDVVATLESCTDRCHSLSNFITSYANVVKIPAPSLRKVDINHTIVALRPFLESLITQNITLRCSLPDEPVEISADPVLIEQVIVNVFKNALESIANRPDSHIDITVTATKHSRTLTISDDGPGISPDAVGHIFSPFFSTKPGGRGLGLMFVAEILRRHSATFSLATESNSQDLTDNDTPGAPRPTTTFTIQFPHN